LLAVYGLRSGEVRNLRWVDLDWTRRILRVRRSKTDRVQEYPLTTATGQALRRYLKEARPDCARP
jgi:integrase